MKTYELRYGDFDALIKSMMDDFEVIAPVKTDLVRFSPITDASQIHLEKNAFFPVKNFFFRDNQVMFKFHKGKVEEPKPGKEKRIFFGIRKCDLNGIMHQDKVFGTIKDPYYAQARENSYLIGYHCPTAPSPYCFCGSMGLKDFSDLMFYRRNEISSYVIEVGSKKGEELIKKFRKFFTESEIKVTEQDKVIPGSDRLENKDISKKYDDPRWQKGADQCISCGACTNLCPTCYCFEVHDEVKTGEPEEAIRKRSWSSCQLQSFTRVAGDHIFRKERLDRFKHRIYHQLVYFRERYDVNLCVGCGRCIEGCPTRIDFVKIANEMK